MKLNFSTVKDSVVHPRLGEPGGTLVSTTSEVQPEKSTLRPDSLSSVTQVAKSYKANGPEFVVIRKTSESTE